MPRIALVGLGTVVCFAIVGSASVITAQTVASSTAATSTDTTAASSTYLTDASTSISTSSADTSFTNFATTTTATSTVPQAAPNIPSGPLTCTTAYTGDLYDTPSGHLDSGYTTDVGSATGTLAHVIGTQAWVECHDRGGNAFEYKISPDQYAALANPDAQMPNEPEASQSESTISLGDAGTSTQTASSTSATSTAATDQSSATSSDDATLQTPLSNDIASSSAALDASSSPTTSDATSAAVTAQ